MGVVGISPSLLLSNEILNRLEIDDSAYQAAAWIRSYASELGLSYPENYVLAEWGRARMYNYFVNGESRTYGYARQHYESFINSQNPDEWYGEFEGRVGFVITRDIGDVSAIITQGLLHNEYGSGAEFIDGVSHYRAVWQSDDGAVKVFEVVPGATIEGSFETESEVKMSTAVSLAPEGTDIEFQRIVPIREDVTFSVTVPHPGEYEVGDRSIRIPESAVQQGDTIQL